MLPSGEGWVGQQGTFLLHFISFLFASFEVRHEALYHRLVCTLKKVAELNNSKFPHLDLILCPILIKPVVPLFGSLHFACDGVSRGNIEAFKCDCWQANLFKSTLCFCCAFFSFLSGHFLWDESPAKEWFLAMWTTAICYSFNNNFISPPMKHLRL